MVLLCAVTLRNEFPSTTYSKYHVADLLSYSSFATSFFSFWVFFPSNAFTLILLFVCHFYSKVMKMEDDGL